MRRITLCMILASALLIPATASPQGLSEPWADRVKTEILSVLDGYREAILDRDYQRMLNFWSESEDFVFAGDGRILGGSEAWRAETTRHYDATSEWQQWDWQSVYILPLAETAASATLEFRFRWVASEGATHNSRGSWTYVFRKEGDAWKVIHTNGTHVEL